MTSADLARIAMEAYDKDPSPYALPREEVLRRVEEWALLAEVPGPSSIIGPTSLNTMALVTCNLLEGLPSQQHAAEAIGRCLAVGRPDRAAQLLGTFLATGTIEGDRKIRRRAALLVLAVLLLLTMISTALVLAVWSTAGGAL